MRSARCEVDLFFTDHGRFDVTRFPQYFCVAFGSQNYYGCIGGGLKTFMDDHCIHDVRMGLKGLKGKPYVLFYSHGGGGRVIQVMRYIFRRVGTLVGEPVESRGCPGPQALEQCKALGKALAEAVLR